MTSVFTGVHVVEITTEIAGAIAGQYLADNGASVTRIELPAGDALRGQPAFHVYNRGKRSVVADWRTPAGLDSVRSWVRAADAVLVDLPAPEACRYGLDHAGLAEGRTDLVYTALPPFGDHGPMAGWYGDDALASAFNSLMGEQASYAGPPTFIALPVSSHSAALLAAGGTAIALMHRARSGIAQRVVQSVIAGGMAATPESVGNFAGTNMVADADVGHAPLGNFPVFRVYKASDDYFGLACGNEGFWHKLCLMLDHPEWIGEPLLDGAPWGLGKPAQVELCDRLETIFATRPRAEWLTDLRANDIPAASSFHREEFFASEQVQAAGMRIQVEDRELGLTTQVGLPLRFSRTPGAVVRGAPPLGDTTGHAPPPRTIRTFGEEPLPSSVLGHLKIVDLSGYIAGTYAPTLITDLGADTIKIESTDGDPFRPIAYAFLAYNRGKRGIVLDLKTAEAREIVYRLVADADIVVENFRPGTAGRLGFDYETLSEMNPRIIYLSAYAYGSEGPRSGEPGFDTLLQTETGVMKSQGGGPDAEPVYYTAAVCDFTTAILGAAGIMFALYEREVSGRGQRVETSLMNAGLALQAADLIAYPGSPSIERGGRDTRGLSPLYRCYRARDGWLFLDARAPGAYAALCRTIPLASAPCHAEALAAAADGTPAATIAAGLGGRPVDDAVDDLRAAGIAAIRILRGLEVASHPQTIANHLTDTRYHALFGRGTLGLNVPQFDRLPPYVRRPAPYLGQHTRDVLLELGYSPETVEEYIARGIATQGNLEEQRRQIATP